METQDQKRVRNVLTPDDCYYYSEELFFRIINCYYPNIDIRLKIRMRINIIVIIRHHILESECGWAEEKFFDYALKRIRESYDYVTEKVECQDVNTLNTVQRS